jgi:hypothetical protein
MKKKTPQVSKQKSANSENLALKLQANCNFKLQMNVEKSLTKY